MRFERRILAVVCVIVAGGAMAYGQAVQTQPVVPTVISGNDIGFRMEGRKGTRPVGRLVVRIDGQWVEAELAGGIKLITK